MPSAPSCAQCAHCDRPIYKSTIPGSVWKHMEDEMIHCDMSQASKNATPKKLPPFYKKAVC